MTIVDTATHVVRRILWPVVSVPGKRVKRGSVNVTVPALPATRVHRVRVAVAIKRVRNNVSGGCSRETIATHGERGDLLLARLLEIRQSSAARDEADKSNRHAAMFTVGLRLPGDRGGGGSGGGPSLHTRQSIEKRFRACTRTTFKTHTHTKYTYDTSTCTHR